MGYEEWIKKYNIKLNEQQQKAVLTIDGSILLLAVPGSGKTTVIISRVGYMILCKNISPENILTLTYSRAAANDMKERFNKKFGSELGENLSFRTINSFCYDVLSYYERLKGTKKFQLINDNDKYKIIGSIYRQVENNFPTESIIADIVSKIAYFKNMMLSDKDIEKIEYEDADIYEIYKRYKEYNEQNKLMDFDDQLVYAYIILENYASIKEFYKTKYKYINVDEAQDTSKIQHEIINLLVKDNIFMVGDEDQSIYKFRGAYPEALLHFEKRYVNSKVLLMETNYRSTPEIVEASNKHIKRNKIRKEKNMIAHVNSGNLVIKKDINDLEEQYEYLLKLAKHSSNKSLAFIYKNNDSAIPLIWLFKEKNIKFNLKGGEITFFSNKIVRDIKLYINFINNLNDIESFKEIYYKIGCSITKGMLEEVLYKISLEKNKKFNILDILLKIDMPKWKYNKISSILKEILILRHQNSYKIIYSIVNKLGYKDFLLGSDKKSGTKLSAIYEQKINLLYYIAKRESNINRFLDRLEYLEKLSKNNNSEKENITLTTIHSSKGLEFDKVVLIDMNEGIIPSNEKSTVSKSSNTKNIEEDYEEDIRLFYVAITRAKSELEIINCKNSFDGSITISEFAASMFEKKSSKTFLNTLMKKRTSTKNIADFKIGDKVENLTFGIGKILEIKDDTAIVEFRSRGKKNMLLYYLNKV